ncbi:MAG: hypothetical protein R6U44_02565 [Archaeoglobaceae archaeon]
MKKGVPVMVLLAVLLLGLPSVAGKKVDNGNFSNYSAFPGFEVWEPIVENYNPEFNSTTDTLTIEDVHGAILCGIIDYMKAPKNADQKEEIKTHVEYLIMLYIHWKMML